MSEEFKLPFSTPTALERKLSAFAVLAPDEREILKDLHGRSRPVVMGRDLIHQGQEKRSVYILTKGWMCSYKVSVHGERQIVDFQVPGDFLGLRNVLLKTSDHSIEPITQVEVAEVSSAELLRIFSSHPRLAAAVLWAASRDEAMVVEHLIDIGRRDAAERTAHFLLELGTRLSLVGQGDRTGFDCPLTQYHLGDALGLSAIHVNRVLRRLREEHLLTFRSNRVSFDAYDRLVVFAGFDAAYLDQFRPWL